MKNEPVKGNASMHDPGAVAVGATGADANALAALFEGNCTDVVLLLVQLKPG